MDQPFSPTQLGTPRLFGVGTLVLSRDSIVLAKNKAELIASQIIDHALT